MQSKSPEQEFRALAHERSLGAVRGRAAISRKAYRPRSEMPRSLITDICDRMRFLGKPQHLLGHGCRTALCLVHSHCFTEHKLACLGSGLSHAVRYRVTAESDTNHRDTYESIAYSRYAARGR